MELESHIISSPVNLVICEEGMLNSCRISGFSKRVENCVFS